MTSPCPCADCTHSIPESADRCAHCGRPGLFPNVRAAEHATEKAAVQKRLERARRGADRAGTRASLDRLEATAAASKAVICKHIGEVVRLASSDKQGIASYYQLIEAEARVPDGDGWGALRRQADAALFPGYEKRVRFAALSLDRTGVRSYGACSLTLRTDYVAHRTTVFEENSAVFVKPKQVGKLQAALTGFRATWDERGKLAAAKLGARLTPATQEADLPALLLHQGATSADDDFVEAHIYGSITIRTIEHVELRARADERSPAPADVAALEDSLSRFGVGLHVTS